MKIRRIGNLPAKIMSGHNFVWGGETCDSLLSLLPIFSSSRSFILINPIKGCRKMMKLCLIPTTAVAAAIATVILCTVLPSSVQSLATTTARPLRVTVFGGTGYVGSAVCERLVQRGHIVTAISRRGVNPKPNSESLSQVNWIQGDATDGKVVERVLKDSDAAVHAIGTSKYSLTLQTLYTHTHYLYTKQRLICVFFTSSYISHFLLHNITTGLLFDVDSGLGNLNKIVSGSGSIPGESSTYDAITRITALNVISAIEKKQSLNIIGTIMNKSRYPLCFVSCAEAGWPEVPYWGPTIEDNIAPEWLQRYLIAKRSVESRLSESNTKAGTIRSAIYRPSLIWDWTKLDVLPVIPIFNIAAAVGVPFVDKTVRVETLADAIVAGIEGEDVEGIQRVGEMENISQRVR